MLGDTNVCVAILVLNYLIVRQNNDTSYSLEFNGKKISY